MAGAGNDSNIKIVNIHLDVLFSICDSYERRGINDDHRVIGTLLGSNEAGVVEVSSCFVVPHHEGKDEVSLEKMHAHKMFELRKKTRSSDTIVGWFATGSAITDHSLLIHEYYMQVSLKHPVHVTIDMPSNSNRNFSLNAFISATMGAPGKTLGQMFNPIPVKVVQYNADKIAVEVFTQPLGSDANTFSVMSEMDHVVRACQKILSRLDQIIDYVNSIIEGGVEGNGEVGRLLMDLVNSLPQLSPQQLQEMINSSIKDHLMILYLSKLVENQIIIQDKLISMTLSAAQQTTA